MEFVYMIKLDNGKTYYCNYKSVEVMIAKTEAFGLKVIEYWVA